MKQRYKITISYNGAKFSGWQVQPNALSIQEILQDTLFTFLQEKTHVTGSGRTDAGVHAYNQVAHFDTSKTFDLHRFIKAINGMLPKEIRIKSIEKVSSNFHARYSAKGKIYHYHLYLDPISDPFRYPFVYHVKYKLNLKRIEEAITYFIGTKDFTSFSNSPSQGACARNPIKTIYRIDLVPEKGGYRLEFEGSGFLYKMIRNIVGTLIEIGSGKKEPQDIPKILEAKDRRKAGKAAPAHALFLVKVLY